MVHPDTVDDDGSALVIAAEMATAIVSQAWAMGYAAPSDN